MKITLPIKDSKLLQVALTHRSYLNENHQSTEHNERLEFLGDAVLELAVSEYLYQRFPDKPEGDLTSYRASLVKTSTLAELSEDIDLGSRLRLSKGEEQSGGRSNKSLLANTSEAVIGAIYLDQNFSAVKKFLEIHLFPKLAHIIKLGLHKDHKSTLQELVQSSGHDSPEYNVTKETGPDHDKQFTISVTVGQKVIASGSGKSKQSAQQSAAREALEKLSGSW